MNMMFNLPTGLTDSNGPRLTIEHGEFVSHTSNYVRDALTAALALIDAHISSLDACTAGNNRTPELCKRDRAATSTAGPANLKTPLPTEKA